MMQQLKEYVDSTDIQNKVFQFALANSPEAQSYLRLRHISEEMIGQFGIGYAPDTEANFYYRNRITMPITDPKGNIEGWCARAIDKDAKAKTLYTPNNTFFQKGVVVFGISFAIETLFSTQTAILVEGAFDALRLHQIGIHNVLAVLGTNPTESQLSLVRMLAPNLVLLFDGDDAGRRGAKLTKEKSKNLLYNSIITVALPDREDPDSLGIKDAQKLKNLLTLAQLGT